MLIGLVTDLVCGVVVIGLRYDAIRNQQGESEANATPFLPPVVGGPRAIFVGDSYVSGAGASDVNRRWSSLVSVDIGWTGENIAIGSTGHQLAAPGCGAERCGSCKDMASFAVTLDAPIVVVGGGSNDFAEFVRDPTGVVNAIFDTFGTLRTGLPAARTVAVGPASAGNVPPFATAYEEGARRRGRGWWQVRITDRPRHHR